MLSTIEAVNSVVNNFIWGVPAMICIIGVGLYLSIRTRFLQIRKFPYAMKITLGRMLKKKVATVAHRQHTTGGTLGLHAAGEGLSCCLAGETPFEGVESYEYLHVVVFLWAKLVISMVSAKLSGRIICIIGEESVILRHESSIRPQQVHHHRPGIA